MAEHNDFGNFGERIATNFLTDKGYIILARNYRAGKYEIDIIALDNDTIVVVEVKTRSDNEILEPEDAVDRRKRMALIRAADRYVVENNRQEEVRFDIIAIVRTSQDVEIRHIEDAFNSVNF